MRTGLEETVSTAADAKGLLSLSVDDDDSAWEDVRGRPGDEEVETDSDRRALRVVAAVSVADSVNVADGDSHDVMTAPGKADAIAPTFASPSRTLQWTVPLARGGVARSCQPT